MKNSRRGFLKLIGLAVIATQIPIDLAIKAKQKIKKYLTFNEMLKEHLPTELIQEALVKRDYIFSKIEIDDNFHSSPVIIPFDQRDNK